MNQAGTASTQTARTSWLLPAATIMFACAALVARTTDPESLGPTVLAGIAGLLPALHRSSRVSFARRAAVTLAGMSVFAAARLMGGSVGVRVGSLGIFSLMVASVSEEILFRRFIYGVLERFGPSIAIGVSSILFAFIHLPMYGMRAMPIDLAAGAVLGWQRWASGTWASPALTHAFANLVMIG